MATITRRMAPDEKPYRVYRSRRGGLRMPKVSRSGAKGTPRRGHGTRSSPPRSRRRRVLRWAGIAVSVFLLWVAAWSLAGYFSFRDGVEAANRRLPKPAARQLSGQDGLLLTKPSTILVLGTDTGKSPSRRGLRHSDSMMLVRTDPDRHRISYLSIPRDLFVEIPGYGTSKINTAYQAGGPALALKTVRSLTGLDIDHVVIVDFERFKDLIDGIGGIEVNVPRPIQSNRFDCPYDAEGCATWDGWRFEKGRQHMDGRRALVYSRIRENRLDPADNDITRGERQQQVAQAVMDKLTGVGTFLRLPFNGSDLLRPLTTDLTAGELAQLGWVKFRADNGNAVRCRLGGYPDTVGGAWVLRSSEENRNVISMFTGDSAPQPPPPGTGTYGPGCAVGSKSLGSR